MNFAQIFHHKWLRRLGFFLIGLAFIWVLLWLAVPPLLKSQVEKIASNKLGRALSLSAVHFKPWSLELELEGLKIAAADATAPPQLEIAHLYIDAELQSLFRLAPVVDALRLSRPVLRVRHLGGGRYDLDDLIAKFQPTPAAPPSDPLRFALYNLSLIDGNVEFIDQPVNKTHVLNAIQLQLPFLSNLDSKRQVRTEPHLAFKLNGVPFDSRAEATPFAQTRKTQAQLRFNGWDSKPYLAYWPAELPLRLDSAVLDADLKLDFEQNAKSQLLLRGSIALRELGLSDAQSRPLLQWQRLALGVQELRPLDRFMALSTLELQAPALQLTRLANGQLRLPGLGAKAGPPPAKPELSSPADAGWQIQLAEFKLSEGSLTFQDQSTTPPFKMGLTQVAVQLRSLQWPLTQPLSFSASAALPGGANPATLSAEGSASAERGEAKVQLNNGLLSLANPYLAAFLQPQLEALASAEAQLRWDATGLQDLVLDKLSLSNPGLIEGKVVPVSARQIELKNTVVDFKTRSAKLGALTVRQPQATVTRDTQGRWMVQHWLKSAAQAPAPAAPAVTASPTAPNKSASPDWRLVLEALHLQDGAITYKDELPSKPVLLQATGLDLRLNNFELGSAKPAALKLKLALRGATPELGNLQLNAQLKPQPLSLQSEVQAQRLPLQALAPYGADLLNLDLLRADASLKGQLGYTQTAAGPQVQWRGDLSLEDVRSFTPPSASEAGEASVAGEELFSAKLLALRGVDLALNPGQPLALTVSETALSDFYARLIVYPNARLNLQDLVKPVSAGPGATPTAAPVAAAGTTGPASAGATTTTATTATTTTATTPTAEPAPQLRFGPMVLNNGRVLFSDRFIKPNYSANLTELNGRLSAFESERPGQAVQLAELDLRGRAEGSAALEVRGQLNPLTKPLVLDIQGKVRDLELPPLSPYAVKYAGYGITRGKLSVDVAYKIQPDGQLNASNNIVLNQLAFGDKVEGASGNLPVKLAVALLADRDGVININLPVSGSLNDPQFSIGPIVFKLIVNLIVKAITAPFSLLASALGGGGGEELSAVAFEPGSAQVNAQAQAALDKIAQALAQRPALKLSLSGSAALAQEREGFKRERLKQSVLEQKRRAAVIAGAAPAAVVVSEAEYPTLLKEVYRRADISKPRNLVGLAKDLSVAEMETLLLANLSATPQQMRELALARGVAVRDYLASKQIPSERLFLGAVLTDGEASAAASATPSASAPALPSAVATGENAAASTPAKSTPKAGPLVQLSLGM